MSRAGAKTLYAKRPLGLFFFGFGARCRERQARQKVMHQKDSFELRCCCVRAFRDGAEVVAWRVRALARLRDGAHRCSARHGLQHDGRRGVVCSSGARRRAGTNERAVGQGGVATRDCRRRYRRGIWWYRRARESATTVFRTVRNAFRASGAGALGRRVCARGVSTTGA